MMLVFVVQFVGIWFLAFASIIALFEVSKRPYGDGTPYLFAVVYAVIGAALYGFGVWLG